MRYPILIKLVGFLLILDCATSNFSLTPQLIHQSIAGDNPDPPGVLIYHPAVLDALESLSVITDGDTHKEFSGLYERPLPKISQSLFVNHTNTLLLKTDTKVLPSVWGTLAPLASLKFMNFVFPRRSLFKFNEALKETHQNSQFPSILQRRYLNVNTQLMSVGTATMTAQWAESLRPTNFGLQVFHSQLDKHGGNRSVAIDSLVIFGNFLFSEFDGLKLVHLPLSNNVTLLILLSPQNTDNKPYKIPNQYDPIDLLKKGSPTNVEVQMPKIEFEYRTELVPQALNRMGIHRVHEKNADFGKLTLSQIKLSNMVHATSIRIDEFGINEEPFEILNFTLPTRSDKNNHVFVANHPFYFSIVSENHVLFSGEFLGP
ncbi:plasminogen activator inhibitor 2 type A-like [Drosophila ficusphila]|uniref:plasminogen activator inhibitor 2 type A-like n=1 Tax=Drosophila ficusphila TaxID=30025 RepID=UPI0007E744D2|nr:plasminogen activator inhibitor 2 type A-like [Drosophila ficusphila]